VDYREPVLTRRAFITSFGAAAFGVVGTTSYAFAIEPRFRLVVTPYRVTPPGWSKGGRALRVSVIADIHACDPWMPLSRVEEIVAVSNDLKPDVVLLLGDFIGGMHHFDTSPVPPAEWGRALSRLEAPLGVHAVLGNHDWWNDVDAVRGALTGAGVPVMENDAVLMKPDGAPAFWLAGLGDQLAYRLGRGRFRGVDDLPGTLARIPDDGSPVILAAHEPDIFPKVPGRVSLTLSGHTHGGQVALPVVGRMIVPSEYGQRYAYGHVVENERHLIVSGGLGCSTIPVRFGVPPEVVVIDIGGEDARAPIV
jgi:predicted MPP superfamily phosphohydrolase